MPNPDNPEPTNPPPAEPAPSSPEPTGGDNQPIDLDPRPVRRSLDSEPDGGVSNPQTKDND